MNTLFDKSQLLPLFEKYVRSCWDMGQTNLIITPQLQLQVLETSPCFLVFDGYNTVKCEFTKSAIQHFSRTLPLVRIEQLERNMINVTSYKLLLGFTNSDNLRLRLVIDRFYIIRIPQAHINQVKKENFEQINKSAILNQYKLLFKTTKFAIKLTHIHSPIPNLEHILIKKEAGSIPPMKVNIDNVKKDKEEEEDEEILVYKEVKGYEATLHSKEKTDKSTETVAISESESINPTMEIFSSDFNFTPSSQEEDIQWISKETLYRFIKWRESLTDNMLAVREALKSMTVPNIKVVIQDSTSLSSSKGHKFQLSDENEKKRGKTSDLH